MADETTQASDVLNRIGMGSTSDWPTMKHAAAVLEALEIPHETRVVSAHRTRICFFIMRRALRTAVRAIIAGAGGGAAAGHAGREDLGAVLGVGPEPRPSPERIRCFRSLRCRGGFGRTLAIGNSGAKNAGLLAAAMIGMKVRILGGGQLRCSPRRPSRSVSRPSGKHRSGGGCRCRPGHAPSRRRLDRSGVAPGTRGDGRRDLRVRERPGRSGREAGGRRAGSSRAGRPRKERRPRRTSSMIWGSRPRPSPRSIRVKTSSARGRRSVSSHPQDPSIRL